MVKKISKLFFCFLVIGANSSIANDSVIGSYGGVLVPLKETNIVLKKEILEFTETERGLETKVYFEFFNPGESTNLTVGFISPPIKNWNDKSIEPLNIRNFIVHVNEKEINYSISQFDSSDSNFPEYYVFKFEVNFQPGINKIKHKYIFDYARSSLGRLWFNYVLKSGLSWANGEIEDFKLIIDLGNNVSYDVPYNFGIPEKKHYWMIDGKGKMDSTDYSEMISNKQKNRPCLYVFVKQGKLVFEKKHFKPTKNIDIRIYDPVLEMTEIRILNDNDITSKNMKRLSNEDIRIVRNALFAKYGYKFKSKDLFEFFSKYFWYMPDENVPSNVNILEENERRLFYKIQELQKLRENENTK